MATPFLRAAAKEYAITLVAKPHAQALRDRFWPEVQVMPFHAPWTVFKRKYALARWPWRALARLRRNLAAEHFDFGVSARWDPRDHMLLWMAGAKSRLGFPRLRSHCFLTKSVPRPLPRAHRYEYWQALGRAMNLPMPPRDEIPIPVARPFGDIFIHSGAAQAVRVWPLERFHGLAQRLRAIGERVLIACDPDQRDWWLRAGESQVHTPANVTELIALADRSGVFVGNDSGPGHLAAFCGVPTLTLFGPQLPEWFGPLHPRTLSLEGKPCPYKPCSDYCRYSVPHCLQRVSEVEVWERLRVWLANLRHGAV